MQIPEVHPQDTEVMPTVHPIQEQLLIEMVRLLQEITGTTQYPEITEQTAGL